MTGREPQGRDLLDEPIVATAAPAARSWLASLVLRGERVHDHAINGQLDRRNQGLPNRPLRGAKDLL